MITNGYSGRPVCRRPWQAILFACLLAIACGSPAAPAPIMVDVEFLPPTPITGQPTQALISVTGPDGRALNGVALQVEAHMSHPGMAPVVADVASRGEGKYAAPVDFTMAGEWVVVASGTLPDGRRISQTQTVTVAGGAVAP